MSAEQKQLEVSCTVTITPSDDAPADWLSRSCTYDFPYKHSSGRFLTTPEVLEHLAYNAVVNGVEDASRLDGWGDLERGMLTMTVSDVEVSR